MAFDHNDPMGLIAHTVKVAADVAVTIHVEPNHNPKAGETAQAWFLLTKAGGKQIPVQDCDCQLAVYAAQGESGEGPILQPKLLAVAAEQYQNLPGADIVFPQPGAYRLTLTGTPKQQADFQPFETSFDVTVATGSRSKSTSTEEPVTPLSKNVKSRPDEGLVWGVGGAIALVLMVSTGALLLRQRFQKH